MHVLTRCAHTFCFPSLQTEREMSIRKGAKVTIVQAEAGKNWWMVRAMDGIEGFVPVNYIRVTGPPMAPKPKAPVSPSPDRRSKLMEGGGSGAAVTRNITIYAYNATREDELTVVPGTVVHVVEQSDDGWVFAKLENSDVSGWLPESYLEPYADGSDTVTPAQSTDTQGNTETPAVGVSDLPPPFPTAVNDAVDEAMPPPPDDMMNMVNTLPPPVPSVNIGGEGSASLGRVVALYDFKGSKADELDFNQGEEFDVVQRMDDAWMLVQRGDGSQGFVPATYMRALDADDEGDGACVFMYTCVHIHVFIYTCIHIHVFLIYIYIHIYMCIHIYMYTYTCVYMYT